MPRYSVAESKAVAVARMYSLGGAAPEPLGPGSKEKKTALQALGRAVGLDLSEVHGKSECGRRIAATVRVVWDDDCHSTGDTVTLVGMNRLLDGVVDFKISSGSVVEDELVSWLMSIAPVPLASESTKELDDVSPIAEETKQDISDRLSRLSQARVAPEGLEPAPEPFEPEDVGFDDGRWRGRLADVQGWLGLAADIDDGPAEAFDSSLVYLLGVDAAPGDSDVFEALASRLERAVDLCESFETRLESIDEGAVTLGTVTQEWAEAWAEIGEETESEGSGPIKAKAATWPIQEFKQLAIDRELELSPSYQRADVWPTGDAQLLIESVLRGIPLPSVILLKRDDENGTSYEVVDGKQRLTSILRFMARHPGALEIVEAKSAQWSETGLVEIFQSDYPRFKKMWKKHESTSLTAQVERALYFPFPLRSGDVKPLSGEFEPLRGKYYSQIAKELITVVGSKKKIQSVFEQVSDYQVPVIVYEQVTSAQIHEVFSLYNKQGKHLNAEEIRNALYHQLALMRALLATAGDSNDLAAVAPFLVDAWDDVGSTQGVLDSYGFAKAGFKRTKLLSWVAAALLLEDGRPDARSTANQINGLLRRVKDHKDDRLRQESTVVELMLLLDHAVDAHAVIPVEVWAETFKVAKGNRWQELQLVATLIALAAARVAYGEQLENVLESRLEDIRQRSASSIWKRPEKTQSKIQWEYTAGVVKELLEILDVDAEHVDQVIRDAFGSSGLGALLALTEGA